MTRLGGLSGLVAKGYRGHRHDWQRTERHLYGVTFKLFVCTGHEEPIIKAYDMEVMSREEFHGQTEYRGRK